MLPIITFRKGTSLKQITGTNTIHNNEKLIKTKINHHTGKCVPCNSTRCLCCQQLISTTTFKSNQTNKMFKIYHRVNCKSSFVIYLLECYICNIQYVGKSETPFNIRLNSHRKNVENPNAIPACKHFNRHDHDFNNHGKIIIIEQLRNICMTSTETLKERLKQWENFWMMKLETLVPPGLSKDLNWIHFMQTFFFTSIIFRFCIWSKITDVSYKMTSNTFSTCKSQIWHIPWERPWPQLVGKNSLFLLVVAHSISFNFEREREIDCYIFLLYFYLYR